MAKKMTWLLWVMVCLPSLCLLPPRCLAQTFQLATFSTPLGPVTGRMVPRNGKTLYQFYGVPYAHPPIGSLRFQKPVAVQPWIEPLNATEFRPSCTQPDWGADMGVDMDDTGEDCLYLNIYTVVRPTQTNVTPKAVLVWIHGGGFVAGAGRTFDGSLMAVRGDVVVVTINYRLGMLGWMSTLDDALRGNFGLWDQHLAFQWVRDNIAAFGGNPNQITIFGESGGGYSVGLHAVSPLNMGLIQRVIMQSGSALNRRTIHLDPVGFARRVGESLNCIRRLGLGIDTQYLADCARQRSVNDILAATSSAARRSTVAWLLDVAPVVDGQLIPEHPRELMGPRYRGRVPFWNMDVMVGTTNAEGSLVLAPLVPFQGQLSFNARNGIPTRVLCTNISTALARDYFPQNSAIVANELCRLYSTSGGDAEQGRAVVDLYGDMMFQSAAVETLLRHANGTGRHQRHFQYLFSHEPAFSPLPQRFPWFRGAGHGAEINFVFGMFMLDQNEARLSLAMIEGWTNFAKFGTPNAPQNTGAFQWPEYDTANRAYTDLDLVITAQNNLYGRRMDFWMSLVPNISSEVTTYNPGPQGARYYRQRRYFAPLLSARPRHF